MAVRKIDPSKVWSMILKNRVKSQVEAFSEYTLEIEAKFAKDKKRLSKSFDKEIKSLSAEEQEDIAEWFAEDHYLIEEIQLVIFRNSTLVSIYSFLEHELNHLCKHLCSRNNYAVKLGDLRGGGIIRAKNYLQKLAQMDFSSLKSEWSDLLDFNKIRNCIVHCEGNIKISGDHKHLQTIISKNPDLDLQHDRYIKPSMEYLDDTITYTGIFLSKVYDLAFKK